MTHQPTHHGRPAPTIDAHPDDGVFAAVVLVPIAVVAVLWVVQMPTVVVGVAGFVAGAQVAQRDITTAVARAIPTDIRGNGTETDEPPSSTTKAVQ